MARRASSSGYHPVEVPTFAGLDFRADPQDGPPGAVDLLNVDFDRQGRVRSRDGTVAVYSGASASASQFRALGVWHTNVAGGTDCHIVTKDTVSGTVRFRAIDYQAGTSVATLDSTAQLMSSVMYSSAAVGSVLYIGTNTGVLIKYSDGAFTSVSTGSHAGRYLAVQSPDNRLVAAGVAGSSSVPDRVAFSNANDSETWSDDDFVDLAPGDGEGILGTVAWNNMVFVFKQSAFFVFTGNSVDNSGGAIFNYRTVKHDLPPMAPGSTRLAQPVATGPEGVYFLARDGVYLTTGGQPVRISTALDWLFVNKDAPPYFGADTLEQTVDFGLYYVQDKLLLVDRASTLVFVYRPRERLWTMWDFGLPASNALGSFATVYPDSQGRSEFAFLYMPSAGGSYAIAASDKAVTTDRGNAMTSSYQTAFMDLGDGGAQKRVREWILHGSGDFTCRTAVDDQSAFEATAASPSGPFGSGPVYEYRHRRASRGRNISLRIDSTDAWSLSRIIANVAGQRPESERG